MFQEILVLISVFQSNNDFIWCLFDVLTFISFPVDQLNMFMKDMRTQFGKLTKPKSGKGVVAGGVLTERDQWILDKLGLII